MFPENVMFHTTKKIGRNILFNGKTAFFFKNMSFQQPHSCYRNDLIASTVFARLLFGILQMVP